MRAPALKLRATSLDFPVTAPPLRRQVLSKSSVNMAGLPAFDFLCFLKIWPPVWVSRRGSHQTPGTGTDWMQCAQVVQSQRPAASALNDHVTGTYKPSIEVELISEAFLDCGYSKEVKAPDLIASRSNYECLCIQVVPPLCGTFLKALIKTCA